METGEEIAILLMDTQGLFDRETDKIGVTAISSMSTLISSVQIYNLMQTIQSNDLEHLQVFFLIPKSSKLISLLQILVFH